MKLRPLVVAAVGIALAGCVTIDPATVEKMSSQDLCVVYGANLRVPDNGERVAILRQELHRRDLLLTSDGHGRMASEQVRVGDSECAMYAAWGRPVRQNRTTTASGTRVQHVYEGRNYVYTTNGRVTGIQN